MKKLLFVLIGVFAIIALFLFMDRDVITYELNEKDVVVKNGEYRLVGRVSDEQLVEKIEVYHEKGKKLKEFDLAAVTEDALLDTKFLAETRFKKDQFKGLQLTTEKVDGKDKIIYHFEHAGINYRHKVLPIDSNTRFFYWGKLHAQEE